MRTPHACLLVLVLVAGLVLSATADDEAAGKRPYALNETVAEFSGPVLHGGKVSLSDLEITVEKAQAVVFELAKAHLGGKEPSVETEVASLQGTSLADFVGRVGQRFGIAPSESELEEIGTLEDVVDWVDQHEVAPLLIVAWSPKCSWCMDRTVEEDGQTVLQEGYTRKLDRILYEDGVRMVFVACHAYEERESIEQAMKELEARWLVVLDPAQDVIDLFGATVTPEVFILDTDLTLRYRGGVDNGPDAPAHEGRREYLREAIDALLNEQPLKILRTEPLGCPYMRKR